MYCLSLYGYILWTLSSPSVRLLQVSFSKILRNICHLLRIFHTFIVLCTAETFFVHITISFRFTKFISRCLLSDLPIVKSITLYTWPTLLLVTITCMVPLMKRFLNEYDVSTARLYRHLFSLNSSLNNCNFFVTFLLNFLLFIFSFFHLHLYLVCEITIIATHLWKRGFLHQEHISTAKRCKGALNSYRPSASAFRTLVWEGFAHIWRSLCNLM